MFQESNSDCPLTPELEPHLVSILWVGPALDLNYAIALLQLQGELENITY